MSWTFSDMCAKQCIILDEIDRHMKCTGPSTTKSKAPNCTSNACRSITRSAERPGHISTRIHLRHAHLLHTHCLLHAWRVLHVGHLLLHDGHWLCSHRLHARHLLHACHLLHLLHACHLLHAHLLLLPHLLLARHLMHAHHPM